MRNKDQHDDAEHKHIGSKSSLVTPSFCNDSSDYYSAELSHGCRYSIERPAGYCREDLGRYSER